MFAYRSKSTLLASAFFAGSLAVTFYGANPANAQSLNIGGENGISVGVNTDTDPSGGIGAGVDASVGGSDGVNAGAAAGVGAAALPCSQVCAA